MKAINYNVLIYIEIIQADNDINRALEEYLRSRGYTSLSSPSVRSHAVFSGHEVQVMSKSESVNDGAAYLRKRLQRLFKKVMHNEPLSCRISLVISPSDVTTIYNPRNQG